MNSGRNAADKGAGASSPMFSIVIPTRQRPGCLKSSLSTVLAQRYDDFEVVVCDNGRDPETAAVIQSFNSDKIRHIHSETVLSLTELWEFALSHTKGSYVTFLHDDSGLMEEACSVALALISATKAEVVSWRLHYYWWPDALPPSYRNHLIAVCGIPQTFSLFIACRPVLSALYKFNFPSNDLPMISNSFVYRGVIQKIKEATGRYFGGAAPDIYSGIAHCWAVEKFLYVQRPLSMQGVSGHTVAAAYAYADTGGEDVRQQYMRENGLDLARANHPIIGSIFGGEGVLQLVSAMAYARDDFFPNDFRLPLNVMSVIDQILAHAGQSAVSYDHLIDAAKEIATLNCLPLDGLAIPPRPEQSVGPVPMSTGATLNDKGGVECIEINAQIAGVSDIFAATRLAESLSSVILVT